MQNYSWRCLACKEPNEPDADLCCKCGCPGCPTSTEIARAKRALIFKNNPQAVGAETVEDADISAKEAMIMRRILKAVFILPLVFFAVLLLMYSKAFGNLTAVPAFICIFVASCIGISRGKAALAVSFSSGGLIILVAFRILNLANDARFFK